MSAALYIVIDSLGDPGFDTFVNGKALSQVEGELARLSTMLGLRPLMDFFSMSEEESLATAERFNALAGINEPISHAERWFSPEEGLKTVERLIIRLKANPQGVERSEAVVTDLEEFAAVLEEARTRGLRWHLAVDY